MSFSSSVPVITSRKTVLLLLAHPSIVFLDFRLPYLTSPPASSIDSDLPSLSQLSSCSFSVTHIFLSFLRCFLLSLPFPSFTHAFSLALFLSQQNTFLQNHYQMPQGRTKKVTIFWVMTRKRRNSIHAMRTWENKQIHKEKSHGK